MTYSIDWRDNHIDWATLKGLTFRGIVRAHDDSTVFFETDNGRHFVMGHMQDCCESVFLSEIHGDLEDLVGSPILLADKVTEDGETEWGDHATWTFYKLATVKGYVTLRWYGTSNGYYSESVNIYEKVLRNEH